MSGRIQQKIIDYMKPVSEGLRVADVRIGLGFTSVRLDNGNIGLAWTAPSLSGSCTHVPKAGTLAGRPAGELLDMLGSDFNALDRTIGLATANAIAAGLPAPEATKQDVLEIVGITAGDHVVMVGYFAPLVAGLRETGCRLDILELERDRPGTMSPEEGRPALASCTVAIITSTTIVTGTLDGLLAGLGAPRAVILLGPSSFMVPQVFAGTPVTHIGGSRVKNAQAVERIASEGGGTMVMKPYLEFETIRL